MCVYKCIICVCVCVCVCVYVCVCVCVCVLCLNRTAQWWMCFLYLVCICRRLTADVPSQRLLIVILNWPLCIFKYRQLFGRSHIGSACFVMVCICGLAVEQPLLGGGRSVAVSANCPANFERFECILHYPWWFSIFLLLTMQCDKRRPLITRASSQSRFDFPVIAPLWSCIFLCPRTFPCRFFVLPLVCIEKLQIFACWVCAALWLVTRLGCGVWLFIKQCLQYI